MATERQYLRNTQTEPTAGGIVWDLSDVQGSPQADVGEALNDTAFTEILAFVKQVGDAVDGTSFPVSINVSSVQGTVEWRFRVQRRNSSGAVQASSAYSTTRTTAGTHTETLALDTAWATGDLVALSIELRRTAGHGNVRLFASTQDADSYVDVDLVVPDEEHSGSATVSGGGLVSLAGAVAMAGMVALSGGGAIDAQASTQRSGAVTISGGGSVSPTGAPGVTSGEDSVVITGGGSVSASGQPARASPVSIGAGGAITADGQTARSGDAAVGGGGAVVLTRQALKSGAISTSGGGGVSPAGQGTKEGTLNVSGGGSVSGSGTSAAGASGPAVVSGGGEAVVAGTKAVAATIALSGGGAAGAAGSRNASSGITISDGGAVSLSGAKGYSGPAAISGGGAVTVAGQGQRSGEVSIGGGPFSIERPDGVQDGDMLVFLVGSGDSGTVTPPSGFDLIREQAMGGANPQLAVYRRIADGEPSVYSYSHSESHVAVMARVAGVDSGAPIDADSGAGSTSGQTDKILPAITAEGGLLIAAIVDRSAEYPEPPGSMEVLSEIQEGLSTMVIAAEEIESSGDTGTRTLTGTSAPWAGIMFAIKAA